MLYRAFDILLSVAFSLPCSVLALFISKLALRLLRRSNCAIRKGGERASNFKKIRRDSGLTWMTGDIQNKSDRSLGNTISDCKPNPLASDASRRYHHGERKTDQSRMD